MLLKNGAFVTNRRQGGFDKNGENDKFAFHPIKTYPNLPWNFITMRPEMITQIIRKQFFCVTNARAIGKLIPRQLICVIGTFAESTL